MKGAFLALALLAMPARAQTLAVEAGGELPGFEIADAPTWLAVQMDQAHTEASGDRRLWNAQEVADKWGHRFGSRLEQPPGQAVGFAPGFKRLYLPEPPVDLHDGRGRVREPLPELGRHGAAQCPVAFLTLGDGVRAGLLLEQVPA